MVAKYHWSQSISMYAIWNKLLPFHVCTDGAGIFLNGNCQPHISSLKNYFQANLVCSLIDMIKNLLNSPVLAHFAFVPIIRFRSGYSIVQNDFRRNHENELSYTWKLIRYPFIGNNKHQSIMNHLKKTH